jgi:signal transduction histidine kinase
MWIGTYDGGLYRLAGERLTRYTRENGLHDNGVFQILEDSAGHLWMGSNRGISRVSRRELNDIAEGRRRVATAIVFGAQDGLLSVEVNGGQQPAGLRTADGRLWFPTMGGVAVIDPAVLRINTRAPAPVLEEVRVAGQLAGVSGPVTVPRDAPSFEFRYTAPSFINPSQVRFRYQLVGLDEDWIDAGDRRVATYHRIPPGRYRFRLMAANHHGVWNGSGLSLDVVVLPPFWQTWWFVAASIALMFSMAWVGHELRLRRLRREHARQVAFSQELIDSQETERRRIANEMHDSLGQHLAIIRQRARTGVEQADDGGAAKAFGEIADVAGQIDAEVKAIAYALRPYQLDRIGLSKTLAAMVQRVADACGIDAVVEIASIDDALRKDEHIHVFRIVQESLNNVIKHAQATRLSVVVSRDARSITIRVADDGAGFGPDAASDGGSTLAGLGLGGVRERVRILGGRVDIQSPRGGGTTVMVSVPIKGDTA